MAELRPARGPAEVEGFQLFEALGEGAHSVVYRATCDGRQVALKLATDAADAVAFRREAATLARIDHPGVVRVLTTGSAPDGRPFVAMELLEGESLAARLSRGPLDPPAVVELGCRVAAALAAVHGRGLVHRDLKPANILLDKAGRPRLVDFGLAVRRRRQASEEAVGTFLYSAPEQAGALSLAVDGRADLYSLGAVLYECLVGAPPFESADPGELIHMHAVREPPALRSQRPDVPVELARVIHQLLAKDPADRPADARQLERALAALRGGRVSDAPVAARGGAEPADAAEPLVQRETELGALRVARKRAASGRGQLVLIRAPEGMGRGRLLRTFLDELATEDGTAPRTLRARAEEAGAPYSLLRAALADWVEEARAAGRLDELVDAAVGELRGPLGRALPALGRPDGADAQSDEDRELVLDAALQLLLGVARQCPGGLCLALEHIERADAASQALLTQLVAQLPSAPLLVVATCAEGEGLAPLLGALRAAGHTLLSPAPLDRAGVAKLVRGYLSTDTVDDGLVAELNLRCQGRPGVVVGHLDALIEGGLLTPSWGRWRLAPDAFERLALPEDLTQWSLRTLDELSAGDRQLLRVAAVWGRSFELGPVARLAGMGETELSCALERPCALGILQPEGERLRFVEAAVYDALRGELDPAQRATLHRAAAELVRGDDDEARYRRAQHRFEGCEGADAETAARAFEDNCAAAEYAAACQAPAVASRFFDQAQAIGAAHGLALSPAQTVRRADAVAGQGDLTRSLALLCEVASGDGGRLDRAAASLKAAELCLWTMNDVAIADEHLNLAWGSLGRARPRGGLRAFFHALWLMLLVWLAEAFGRGFGSRRGDPETALLCRLTEQTGALHFFRMQFPIVGYYGVLTAYYATLLGPSRELGFAYAARANTLAAFGMPRAWAERYRDKALALAEELGDRKVRARAELMFASGLNFLGLIEEGRARLERCLEEHWRWLDVNDIVLGQMDVVGSLSAQGYLREAVAASERCMARLGLRVAAGDQRAVQMADNAALSATVLGGGDEVGRVVERMLGELGSVQEDPFRWFMRWSAALGYRHETGQPDAAIDEAADALAQLRFNPAMASWHMGARWAAALYARFRQWEQAEEPAQRGLRASQVERAARELAKVRPAMWRAHKLMGRALTAVVRGDMERGLGLLGEVEREAERTDSPWALYQARRARACVLRAAGEPQASEHAAVQAMALAERMGWYGRLAELSRQFGVAVPSRRASSGAGAVTSTLTHAAGTVRGTRGAVSSTRRGHRLGRDRDALLEVSLAGAEHLDAAQHARASLDTLIKVLDAERGCLFFANARGELERACARDANGADLPADAVLAQSLAQRAFAEQAPLVLSGTAEGRALGSESAVAENVRSIVCAPITLREERLGVLYLDNRLARGVFSSRDLALLSAVGSQIAIGQRTSRLARKEIERQALEKDLQLGRAVQQLLVPEVAEEVTGGVAWAAHYEPVSQVGGDWWYRDARPGGGVRIALGDATGHGAAAAMVTAAAAGCYRSALAHTPTLDSESLLERLQQTVRGICRGQHGMTFTILEVAPDGAFGWVSAGAPPIIQVAPARRSQVHGAASTPLGYERFALSRGRGQLAQGERLLLFSDGLCELPLPGGKELGLRRVRDLFARSLTRPVAQARDALREDVRTLRGEVPAEDDLTFILVEAARAP